MADIDNKKKELISRSGDDVMYHVLPRMLSTISERFRGNIGIRAGRKQSTLATNSFCTAMRVRWNVGKLEDDLLLLCPSFWNYSYLSWFNNFELFLFSSPGDIL